MSRLRNCTIAVLVVWACGVLYFVQNLRGTVDAQGGTQTGWQAAGDVSAGAAASAELPRLLSPPPPPGAGGTRASGGSGEGVNTGRAGTEQQGPESVVGGAMARPAVVVVAYNRPDFLRRTLTSLMGLADIDKFDVYVSQDGAHAKTAAVAESFDGVTLFHHPRDASAGPLHATGFLARHYRFALGRLFDELKHSHVIICEDDMEFSPDFLRFFEQTAPLLEEDPSIWCVSTWNDNGFKQHAWDARRLFRNSFFPGLGWMLRYELWDELRDKWPDNHWDHWMRLSTTHRGRDCVCPEVARNYNFGDVGSNMDRSSFDRFLRDIVHNKDADVVLGDLGYLKKEAYAENLRRMMQTTTTTRYYPLQNQGGKYRSTFDANARAEAIKQGGVHVVVVVKEDVNRVAAMLQVWHEPRAQHRYTTVIREANNTTIILADARRSPYLPEEHQLRMRGDVEIVVGVRGQSCDRVCAATPDGRVCDGSQLEFLNRHSVIMQHFDCADFWMELGEEIPCMVTDPKHDNYGRCLVTPRVPNCAASHAATTRLCPCVPSS